MPTPKASRALFRPPRGAAMLWRIGFIVCVVCAFSVLARSASAQGLGRTLRPPTFSLAKGQPVSIDETDRLLRARTPVMTKATALSTRPAARIISQGASAISCGSASGQPLQIVALAASLKCDPDLIFEYVYNNIEYEPLFGSNKGALGILLDQRGNDIDQAQLLVALLSTAGIPSSAMSYEYGYIRVWGNKESGAAKAPSWLGVKDDAVAIGSLLANGGIPIGTVYENSDGALDYVDVAHVWVQLQIGGTTYVFDPSFKRHMVSTGPADLGTVLGYTQSQFLTDAGGTTDSVSVANLDRARIRSDLVGYANSLISYIKGKNPAWTLNDVAGGKTIKYLTGSPSRQTSLPYLSPDQPSGFPQNWGSMIPNAYRTCFTVSMPGVTPTSCSAPSTQTIQLYSDQTYGHRITVFSTGSNCASGGSCTPTLLIDGQPPPNGQNTGTAATSGSPWQVLTIEITHPYTGELATAADQTTAPALTAGAPTWSAPAGVRSGAAWSNTTGNCWRRRSLPAAHPVPKQCSARA